MELRSISNNLGLWKDIWRESIKGKTVDRILLNHGLRQIKLSGEVLDLGSGGKAGSYHRFIDYQKPYHVYCTDLYRRPDSQDIIELDLEKKFDLPEAQYDAVTCFNVLEHIYDHHNLIAESTRVLKPGGKFIGSVPFLVGYHADPNDYWRYTHQSLERLFNQHGLQVEKMFVLAFGPLTAAWIQWEFVWPGFLKPIFLFFIINIDIWLIKWKKFLQHKFVLGYLFVARK